MTSKYESIKNMVVAPSYLPENRAFQVTIDKKDRRCEYGSYNWLPEWITDKRTYTQKEFLHRNNQQWDSYPKIEKNSIKLGYNPYGDMDNYRYDYVDTGDFIVRQCYANSRCYAFTESEFKSIYTARPFSVGDDIENQYWARKVVGLSLDRCLGTDLPFMRYGQDNVYCNIDGQVVSLPYSDVSEFKNLGRVLASFDDYDRGVLFTPEEVLANDYRLILDIEIGAGAT